jgi:hypothetical protein
MRARGCRVLFRDWDPIGVNALPQARAEYDIYADELCAMVRDEQATETAIAAHLFDISVTRMGVPNRAWCRERADRAAAILVALRPGFEKR